MEYLNWIIQNADRFTAVPTLVLVVLLCVLTIKYLENKGALCEAARLADAAERGKMNKKIGELGARVDIMERLNIQNLSKLADRVS